MLPEVVVIDWADLYKVLRAGHSSLGSGNLIVTIIMPSSFPNGQSQRHWISQYYLCSIWKGLLGPKSSLSSTRDETNQSIKGWTNRDKKATNNIKHHFSVSKAYRQLMASSSGFPTSFCCSCFKWHISGIRDLLKEKTNFRLSGLQGILSVITLVSMCWEPVMRYQTLIKAAEGNHAVI